jgi:hypothetical protein
MLQPVTILRGWDCGWGVCHSGNEDNGCTFYHHHICIITQMLACLSNIKPLVVFTLFEFKSQEGLLISRAHFLQVINEDVTVHIGDQGCKKLLNLSSVGIIDSFDALLFRRCLVYIHTGTIYRLLYHGHMTMLQPGTILHVSFLFVCGALEGGIVVGVFVLVGTTTMGVPFATTISALSSKCLHFFSNKKPLVIFTLFEFKSQEGLLIICAHFWQGINK